jgi:hypothetical protein
LRSCSSLGASNEKGHFGKPTYYYPNGIMFFLVVGNPLRKSIEMDSHGLEGNWEWLIQSVLPVGRFGLRA